MTIAKRNDNDDDEKKKEEKKLHEKDSEGIKCTHEASEQSHSTSIFNFQ